MSDGETSGILLKEKHLQPMASADRCPETRSEPQKVKDFNDELKRTG